MPKLKSSTAKPRETALFIGRFQPFHKGHLHCLKYISNRASKLIIVMGSSQKSNTFQNPLSSSERMALLREVFRQEGISCAKVIEQTDVNDNALWVSNLLSSVPKFDVLYSNNKLVKSLFKAAGFKVNGIPYKNRKDYQGMIIRKKAKALNPGWRNAVPDYLIKLLNSYGFEQRINQ